MSNKAVFERTEKKYVITLSQQKALLNKIGGKLGTDKYSVSTIRSLYFDTPDYRLVRNSIEKPVYKEKLRLRSYVQPNDESEVFLELKKKYKGIVYKRREKLKYSEALNYIQTGIKPKDTQIMREIDYVMHFYGELKPRMFIAYDRLACFGLEDKKLRITFDTNLRCRDYDLDLAKGDYGYPIAEKEVCIMEIKALESMSQWLAKALGELHIYPGSFSKYGTAYIDNILFSKNKGGEHCA